jgi:SAM-dependent methyltransferase
MPVTILHEEVRYALPQFCEFTLHDACFWGERMSSKQLELAQSYWDQAAETYDQKFAGTTIGQLRRRSVWKELDKLFAANDRVLELSCGSGIDAVHLAHRGVRLVSCDLSPRMIEIAESYARSEGVADRVEFKVLPTELLASLEPGRAFDGAFSNFSGLNCVADLGPVRDALSAQLKPGASLLLCVMGSLSPWERIWALCRGDRRRAFQRNREPSTGIAGSKEIFTYRPSVEEIAATFSPNFRLVEWRSIGIALPPSFMEHRLGRFSLILRGAAAFDQVIGRLAPFKYLGDCAILRLTRVSRSS